MKTYHDNHHWIWENKNFPHFTYQKIPLEQLYFKFGQLQAVENFLTQQDSTELLVDVLENEAVSTSAIEGEILQRSSVRSSIQKILRLDVEAEYSNNYHIDNLIEIILDAKTNLAPLDHERLSSWHIALFPTNQSGLRKILAGEYRTHDEEMRIVSGPWEKEKVHYIAPPSAMMEKMMKEFLNWLNENNESDLLIKAGIAHLYFVLIHPFEDGNGRITRAITDYVLAKSNLVNASFYSIATAIHQYRKEYYTTLDTICRSQTLDITPWIEWFMKIVAISIDDTLKKVETIQIKTQFWDRCNQYILNERQKKMIHKILSVLPEPFEGGMKINKYMSLTHTTRITAGRDLGDLVEKDLISSFGSGRGVYYQLNL